MHASSHLLLTLEMHLDTLIVAIWAVERYINFGLRECGVGLAARLGDHVGYVVEFVRCDRIVAANVVGGRIGDNNILEPASGKTKVVVWVTPAPETRNWIIVPDGTMLDVVRIEGPVPVRLSTSVVALGLQGLLKLVSVPSSQKKVLELNVHIT